MLLGSIGAPFALVLAVDASPAKADLNYKIYESLGNLVVVASGSLRLTPTSPNTICIYDGVLYPDEAGNCTGTAVAARPYAISGPSSFPGSGFHAPASSVSGVFTFLYGNFGAFFVDPSYSFGAPIISNAIFNVKTLADIGLTPTSGLLGTWIIDGTSETITVKVANPVPGPLPLVGVGAAFGFSRRLRQRIQRSQAAANS